MPSASFFDQAEGLRQMFAHTRARFVPVVSNPHVAFGGVMLERLCTAFAERGAKVLVIDAGERAGEAGEMAMVELGQCIERLSAQVSFLAARGLPVRFVDAAGSTGGFLRRAAEAAPQCDVVIVHAPAGDLCRMFASGSRSGGAAHGDGDVPIVFADDRPASVTHAYASMKLLAQRADLVVFDLMLAAAPSSPRAERIVAKLVSCTDAFFGGVVREAARVDPAGDATEPPSAVLRRIASARFGRSQAMTPLSSSSSHRAFGAYAELANP
ncbi:MAG: flagellar biosynthesis protein [Caldimonas sp.]